MVSQFLKEMLFIRLAFNIPPLTCQSVEHIEDEAEEELVAAESGFPRPLLSAFHLQLALMTEDLLGAVRDSLLGPGPRSLTRAPILLIIHLAALGARRVRNSRRHLPLPALTTRLI